MLVQPGSNSSTAPAKRNFVWRGRPTRGGINAHQL
jgi:hypothetical protein